MDKKKKIYLLLILVLVAAVIIAGAGISIWKWMEETIAQEAVEVEYNANFALEICGDRPVDSFDPTTGQVECAQWLPFPEEGTVEEEQTILPLTIGEEPARELFQTPVETTDVFNEKSSWLIAEPGVILDDTAAWVIPSVEAEHFVNVPEGGFTYFSLGEGTITVDDVPLVLPAAEGLNYLVLVRGRIDDAIIDSDLNLTVTVTDFVPGHAIWSIMPPGAYVSKDWFNQQLVTSTTTGGTNCGATGCTTVHVVLFDVDSHFYQKFEVKVDNLDSWKLLESN